MNNRMLINSISIGFKDETKTTLTGVVFDFDLNPFYASIRDIEISFPTEISFSEDFVVRLNEMIFRKSVWISNYIKRKNLKLTYEEIYAICRDYVICAIVSDVANLLYGTSSKNESVKKILGDFTVERTKSSNSGNNNSKIADEAKECAESILELIDDMSRVKAMGFVKGENNCGNKSSNRLWHSPKFLSKMPIGANKILESDGKLYKTGYGYGNESEPLYTRN
jgi:hypothetical protein